MVAGYVLFFASLQPIIAAAVAAIWCLATPRRRPGRQIDPAELLVAAHHRPDVGMAAVAPRLVEPGVRAELVAALGRGAEVPLVTAGPRFEGTGEPGGPSWVMVRSLMVEPTIWSSGEYFVLPLSPA